MKQRKRLVLTLSSSLRLLPLLLVVYLAGLVPAASAGSFSLNAWTNDTSSGIVSGQTLWAYHFGNTNTAVVNGVTVPGTGTNGNPSVAGQFTIAGISFVFASDANNLTALGGTGSAVMAKSFIYGGAPGLITVEGLTTGQVYTLSVYGVGIDAPAARASIYTNGTDSIYVDENAVGSGNGLRVDYTFSATATTNLTIVTPTNTSTFHTYGLALRQRLLVTTNSNAGPGSLRQAVLDAATFPGTNTITFASALSGSTITLTSQIVLSNNVAIDASSLSGGITLSGGNTTRIFFVNSGPTVSLLGLSLAGGNATAGGAIYNSGATLSLTRCTLFGNSGSGGGGAIFNPSGILALTDCTLSGNSASFGGAIAHLVGALTLTHCTFALNHSTGTLASSGGGAIDNYNGATLTLTDCILAGNTAVTTNGPDLWMENGTLTASYCLVGDGTSSKITNNVNGNIVGTGASPIDALLAPLGNYGGSTQTMPPLPGSPAIDVAGATGFTTDQRGFPRPVGLAADIGAVEGIYNAAGPGKLTGVTRLGNGSFQFGFTNYSDNSYTVLASTNVALPVAQWSNVGLAVETSPGSGQFQFTDPQAANYTKRFYRVRTP